MILLYYVGGAGLGGGVGEPVVTVARSKTFNARGDSVISQENRVSIYELVYIYTNVCIY